jgi:hypothetical protein
MSAFESRELQRFRYKQGQTLRSQDFRDQSRIGRQVRAWHNRAVHNAYGVVRGILEDLSVEPFPAGLLVHRGLAYDCFGHELLLCSQTSIRLPTQQQPMLLVLKASRADCGCHPSTKVSANCFETARPRIATDAELVWLPERGFSFREGVPIARTDLSSGGVSLDTKFESPSTRPLARPRIGMGTTIPGATPWEIWHVTPNVGDIFATIQVTVDTSSVGFATVPQYFASLQGPVSQIDANTINVIALHFDHVGLMRTDSFVFRFLILVLQLKPNFSRKTLITKYLQDQKAYVSWLGIEENPLNREVNCEHY